MATFLTGKALNEFIYDIIWNAEDRLLIVSPYIKLDSYFKEIFEHHKHKYKLEITIVFGKNESQPNKSLRAEDFDFFKQFKNIAIVYCKDLHAKYYGNDKAGVITSLNLFDKSFEKNVEFGVAYELDFLSSFQNTADKDAWHYSFELAKKSPLVFLKRPVYESGLLSAITGKKYIDADILYDATNEIGQGYTWEKKEKKFLIQFPEYIDIAEQGKERPVRKEKQVEQSVLGDNFKSNKEDFAKQKPIANNQTGYCIRTGVKIPFDLKRPMSYEAYRSWAQFENYNYPEKFCHKTGKPSQGKTSMRNPVLFDN